MNPLPSPALVVSSLALLVSLGGTSYAVIHLPPNSVDSTQIRARAVKNSDLGSSAVTGAKVKDHSLFRQDFVIGQLPAGPQGPIGAVGAPGPVGPAGLTGLTRLDGPAVSQGAWGSGAEVQSATATCPAGSYVTGGGFNATGIQDTVAYERSGPTTYTVIAINFGDATTIAAHVVCASGVGLTSRAALASSDGSVAGLVVRMQAEVNARS